MGSPKILPKPKDAEQRLLLSRGIDSGVNGIVIADANVIGFPVVYVNKVFQQITGYSYHEIVGKSCALLQGPETDPVTVTEIAQALRENEIFVRKYLIIAKMVVVSGMNYTCRQYEMNKATSLTFGSTA